MSLKSSPTLPRRKYGAVDQDDTTASDQLRLEPTGGRSWSSFVIVGMLAVGITLGLAEAVYRLPSPTLEFVPSESTLEAAEVTTRSTGGGGLEGNITPAAVKVHTRPAATADLAPLTFTALNFYHERDGKPAQDYPWLKEVKLIEPHRETTLAVSSPREGYDYRWVVRGGDEDKDDLRAEKSGSKAIVVLTVLDDTLIILEELDSETGVVVRRLKEMVMVKYVRREIRTLTDDERDELFDAMNTMWKVRVDGGNGRELYGDDYADIFAINRLHYKAASPITCDHFHDGLGFMTSHAMITNTFEASLQTVNPKLALPYWDFTIESVGIPNFGEPGSTTQVHSEVFTPTWFGTYDEDDHMVKDGRWAYTPIPKVVVNNPGGISPDVYQKLRAPWNVNDRALYDPHGPVHIYIGGVLDCEKSYITIRDLVGEEAAGELAMFSFVHRKNLYREGIFKCEGSAGVDQKPGDLLSNGQCGCLDYDLTQGSDYETVYDRLALIDEIIGDASSDVKRQVVAIICGTTMNDGDHLQASSSLDPSFWSTHPTMERLWMYSVLTGHITDFTWPDDDITVTKPDGTVESESISLYGETCTGHRGGDVFPFGLLDTDIDGFTIKTGIRGNLEAGNNLTNREALQAFDARSNSLPYVYDTFKWTHCEAEGVNFDDAWENTKRRPKSTRNRPSFKEGELRRPLYSGYQQILANAQRRRAEAGRHA